jgi:hypothetical protein
MFSFFHHDLVSQALMKIRINLQNQSIDKKKCKKKLGKKKRIKICFVTPWE